MKYIIYIIACLMVIHTHAQQKFITYGYEMKNGNKQFYIVNTATVAQEILATTTANNSIISKKRIYLPANDTLYAKTNLFIDSYKQYSNAAALHTKIVATPIAVDNTITGQYNYQEVKEIKQKLEGLVQGSIPQEKSVIIHFMQKPQDNSDALLASRKAIATALQEQLDTYMHQRDYFNAIHFFVYTDDIPHKKVYQKNKCILDDGYFFNQVFGPHKKRSAFLAIKPNGQYKKYYGNAYDTELDTFFKQ